MESREGLGRRELCQARTGALTVSGHKSQEGPLTVGHHAPDYMRSWRLTICVQ